MKTMKCFALLSIGGILLGTAGCAVQASASLTDKDRAQVAVDLALISLEVQPKIDVPLSQVPVPIPTPKAPAPKAKASVRRTSFHVPTRDELLTVKNEPQVNLAAVRQSGDDESSCAAVEETSCASTEVETSCASSGNMVAVSDCGPRRPLLRAGVAVARGGAIVTRVAVRSAVVGTRVAFRVATFPARAFCRMLGRCRRCR